MATSPKVVDLQTAKENGYHKNGYQENGHSGNPAVSTTSITAEWLHDPVEALEREKGPFTVLDMQAYIEDYAIELYNGWLVWQAMGHIEERTVVSTIQTMLDISARKKGFGQSLPDGTECRLDEGNDIIPDASLVSWRRLDEDVMDHGPDERPLLTKCPELIVESRSESNTRKADARKRKMYFANGTLIVWDVDEEHEFIDVYRLESPETAQRFTGEDMIDCEPILPGWRRSVRDIFDKRVSAEAVAGEVAEEWREEGREEGVEIGLATAARNMLNAGMDLEIVAQMTGLPLTKLRSIVKDT